MCYPGKDLNLIQDLAKLLPTMFSRSHPEIFEGENAKRCIVRELKSFNLFI